MAKQTTKTTTNQPTAKGVVSAVIPPDATVKVLVASNPKRQGTASHARFALYKNGATAAQCRAAGILPADFLWDARSNFVSWHHKGKPVVVPEGTRFAKGAVAKASA